MSHPLEKHNATACQESQVLPPDKEGDLYVPKYVTTEPQRPFQNVFHEAHSNWVSAGREQCSYQKPEREGLHGGSSQEPGPWQRPATGLPLREGAWEKIPFPLLSTGKACCCVIYPGG